MEEWQTNLTDIVETVASEVEKFFTDVTEAIDVLSVLSEEVAHQVQYSIATEVDQFFNDLVQPVLLFNDLVQPVLQSYLDFEQATFESEWPIIDSLEPSLQQQPACRGCRHYHGQIYGGNLLICGMHPYGWDEANCPDWEGFRNKCNDEQFTN
jgi:hypothetical protein